jgi:hypothetical protein
MGLTAAIVGIVSAIGTAVSTTYSIRSSNAQEVQAKYAAKVAREQAVEAEMQQRRASRVELGRERAVLGKLGVLPTAGTPLEQLARNAGEAERAAVLARRGLLEEASLYDVQARSISSQRGLLAASNVLSGVANTADMVSPLLKKKP